MSHSANYSDLPIAEGLGRYSKPISRICTSVSKKNIGITKRQLSLRNILCQRVNQFRKTCNVDYSNEDILMTIRPELLDELLKGYVKPEDLVGEGGLLKQLAEALVERCLETEMSVYLNQPQYQTEGKAKRNRCTGTL
jgi:hypothetical protein